MRHFLALRLSDDTRDRLADVAQRLQAWELPAAWVRPDDYHLTVLFLGEVDADEARLLPCSVEPLAGSLIPPRLLLSGLGAQGGKHEPALVYAGLTDAQAWCEQVHVALCEVLDMRRERRFLPHIALCRPRTLVTREGGIHQPRRQWPQLLEAHGLADWGACVITDLVLCRSGDGQTGHQELARWPLLAAA